MITPSYTGASFVIDNYSILNNNFTYTGAITEQSEITILNGTIYSKQGTLENTYEFESMDYSQKFNSIDNNLFEIKVGIYLILLLLLIRFTYSLIISFIGKRL